MLLNCDLFDVISYQYKVRTGDGAILSCLESEYCSAANMVGLTLAGSVEVLVIYAPDSIVVARLFPRSRTKIGAARQTL